MPQSKLSGCSTQFANHLERLRSLLATLQPCLNSMSQQDNQLLFQMLIVRLHTYMEAYFRCMVSSGTFWNPEPVRAYLAVRKPEQSENIVGLIIGHLCRWAEREVAFGSDAQGLRGIVRAVFGVEPFPDDATAAKCRDLIVVRNACAHNLGLVGEAEASQVSSEGVIVPTGRVGGTTFYRLEITPEFFTQCADAVAAAVRHLSECADSHPLFQYPLDQDQDG